MHKGGKKPAYHLCMSIFCCNFAANLFYMESTPIKTPNGWRRPLDPKRHHKEKHWNYKGRGIYHIMLVVAERYPLFGHLTGEKPEEAHIELTEYGEQVLRLMRDIPDYYAPKGYRLKIIASQVMPDHIHLLLQAVEPLPQKIGAVIRGFKSACTALYKREYGCPNDGTKMQGDGCRNYATKVQGWEQSLQFSRIFTRRETIWEPDIAHYHERVVHSYDQIQRTINYIKDNPRRLAMKRANPELFRIQEEIEYKGIKARVMGNRFLFDYPQKEVLRCSRSMTQKEIERRLTACLEDAAMGTVFVSAAISEGEKQICRAIREAGYPLIVLLADGFPAEDDPHCSYYKPSGVYFEACAAGRLLLVEPDKAELKRPEVVARVAAKVGDVPHETKRWRFMAMNEIAERLSQ